jgi:hypothetical protein
MNHRLPIGLDFEGQAAKLSMQQLVESNRVFGVLAYRENDQVPIGWASVDRRNTLPGHDCIGNDIGCDATIWSIHCVTSRFDLKNNGIEKVLMEQAVLLVEELKGYTVESYPEPNSKVGEDFLTWNTFNGYQNTYEELGFTKIDKDFGEEASYYYPMKKKI